MEMRTELQVNPSSLTLGLQDTVMTIGSCFADSMGNRLQDNKFKSLVNPFGTVYNPTSIHKLLLMALCGTAPRLDGYCQREGLFLHHDFHSTFSSNNQDALHSELLNRLNTVGEWLRSCRVLVITYGTAWVYKQRSAGEIVSNCHKIPQQQFDKFLLTQNMILESWDIFYRELKTINPSIQILLTVSPVRHMKDTLPLNGVSKSTLRLACHTLTVANENIKYFPAFEIMNDDLRDYRYYKSDLIHPNEQAEDYIWQKFSTSFFNKETQQFQERWSKVRLALQHRPFNPSSESHLKFLHRVLAEVNDLGQFVDVSLERNLIESQLV